MENSSAIGIESERIAHLLADGFWKVPRYQRGYKWTEVEVEELLNDTRNAQRDSKSEYFLGSIVAAKSEDSQPEIVDGQQRLATVSILIAAIRDAFFSDLKDAETAALIQAKYLLEKDIKTKESRPKLRLSDVDHNFFLGKILMPPSKERKLLQQSKSSHERIENAYKVCRAHVKALITGAKEPETVLHDLIDYLAERTVVILVQVSSQQNAFIIFETLNDRGLDLAITDLLKNFLFHRSGDRIDEVQNRWTEMLVTIEAATDEETVKDFLRHHWSSVHGLTRERELFQKIKTTVLSKQAAFDYAEELKKEAVLFAALHNTSHEFWKGYATPVKQNVQLMAETLGLEKRITPLLLATLAKFSPKEVAASFRMFVAWGVRLTIGYSVAGQLERKYSDAAMSIRSGVIKTAKDLWAFMKDAIPSDTAFNEAFQTAQGGKPLFARYILRALERHACGEAEPEYIPNSNEQELNLEHILPENRSPNTWVAFDEDTYRAYRNRLGNLTLMKATPNSASGNEEWSVKKAEYGNSKLKITSGLPAAEDWTRKEIDARQAAFANDAVKIWPAKPK